MHVYFCICIQTHTYINIFKRKKILSCRVLLQRIGNLSSFPEHRYFICALSSDLGISPSPSPHPSYIELYLNYTWTSCSFMMHLLSKLSSTKKISMGDNMGLWEKNEIWKRKDKSWASLSFNIYQLWDFGQVIYPSPSLIFSHENNDAITLTGRFVERADERTFIQIGNDTHTNFPCTSSVLTYVLGAKRLGLCWW